MAKTYEDIIELVELQVRNFDAFPDAATKLDEQINAVYRYAVALSKKLPLSKLFLKLSENLTDEQVEGRLYAYLLPDDVNDVREDLGVHVLEFRGCNKISPITESSPIQSLKNSIGNYFHQSTFLFTFDTSYKRVYTAKDNAPVKVVYSPKIQLATNVEYNSGDPATDVSYQNVEIPMDDNSIEVLVEAVAAQFTSVNARDLSASQIHSTLSQILSE